MYQAVAGAFMGGSGGGSFDSGGQSDWMSFSGGNYAPVYVNTPDAAAANQKTIIIVAALAFALLILVRKK